MRDDDQNPLTLTYMKGKRNKEKIKEKHLEIRIPLIRGIPMEIKADILTTFRKSSKFKSYKIQNIKSYLCPYIQISRTRTVNLKKYIFVLRIITKKWVSFKFLLKCLTDLKQPLPI